MTKPRPKSECNIQPCMPVLLEEERNPKKGFFQTFSGAACEEIVIHHFLKHGINCARPIVDDGADILVEREKGKWIRGQVKKVVHQYAVDRGMRKRGTGIVYRDEFEFNFANRSSSRGEEDIDFFYHVLLTPLRQLVWETPSWAVPKRDDGFFILSKTVMLDRASWKRREVAWDYRNNILSAYYDPKLIQAYPEFFNPSTVTNFMV